jgi:hypothetical protein
MPPVPPPAPTTVVPTPPPPRPAAAPAERASPKPIPEVTLVEFLNAFCAHCRATHTRIDRAVASSSVRVRRYRVYVWSSPTPPLWAQACACAAPTGQEDALFSELLEEPRDTPEAVWAAARRAGVDVRALMAAVQRGDAAARFEGERRRVAASSIRYLPTLDIGRRRLQGEQSEEDVRRAIQAAAEAANAAARGPSSR